MAICYDISIDIVREDDEEGPYETSLPRQIRSERPLSADELGSRVREAFEEFMNLITGYDPTRANSYRHSGSWSVTSVINC